MGLEPSSGPDFDAQARELLARLRAEAQPPQWKRVLLGNPALFILHFFPHRIEKLEDFHLRLIDTAVRRVRGLILYPAAHGKTTITSTLLPIWAICNDPNIRIQIIGKSAEEAESIMRSIRVELEDNDELIAAFGPFKPGNDEKAKPWGTDQLSVANRTIRAKEPTIAVFGSGASTILGRRTDWTICDDVITERNSATQEQRMKTREWFDLCVETGPEHDHSRLTVVGTLFDPADLYHDLIDMVHPESGEHVYHVQREDAVLDEDNKVTLWPEKWTWDRLMSQKAKMGTLNFNKRYRNIAVDSSRMVFREEYVKGGYLGKERYPGCLDHAYCIGDYDDTWLRYGGFDPAVGLTRSAKFCAHVTLGVGSCKEHERCFWIIDLKRDQMTLPQQADLIISQHQHYDLFGSVVEANSYQGGLVQLVDERSRNAGLALNVEPHYTSKTNKPDPEAGVQAMAPWFEQGKVHIPWGDLTSRRVMGVLVDELIMFPGRTTDTVMAFWFAWRRAQEQGPKYRSTSRVDERSWVRKRTRSRILKNPAYWRPEPIEEAQAS